MVYDRCSTVASLIVKFLLGKRVSFDVSQLVERVVSRDGGGYVCRFCGGVFRLNTLVYHLRRRHCGELLELWGSLRPKPLYRGGGGRVVFMPFKFVCRGCGWSVRLELPCNAGPPSVRRKLVELLGVVIPRSCPKCGRVFDVSRIEFGFASDS
jgi:ribosomal protein L37AE/L43A